MRKIIKNSKFFFAISIGLCVVIIAKCLIFFKNIRFGIIYSSRVGHLCHNLDVYFTKRSSNEVAIFGLQKKISNQFILDRWKENKNIFFSKIGFYGFFFLKNFFPKDKMLIDWSEIYPNYSTVMSSKKNFNTDIVDKKKIINIIGKDITPYICFHNRDDYYLKKEKLEDGNDHHFRNFNFNDFILPIKYINSNNIKAVRVGRATNINFLYKNYNYFDFTNNKSSDLIDVLLINNCEFLVASATGLSNIASILRKKILLVNLIPFWLREMYQYTKGSIFLPKKIFCKKKKRLLKFCEIESLKYDIHKKNFFEKRDLFIINNTQNEILSSLKEMLEIYSSNNLKRYESKLHDKFWFSLNDKKAVKIIRHELKINISDTFLKKNKLLI